jgi:hypothetical protein
VPLLQVDLQEVFVAKEHLAELALEVEDLVVEDLLYNYHNNIKKEERKKDGEQEDDKER